MTVKTGTMHNSRDKQSREEAELLIPENVGIHCEILY
jgi:hypothetical protein